MAEKVRFELTVLAYTRVPGVHLKPLGHLSVMNATIIRLPGTAELGSLFYPESHFFTTEN